MAANKFLYKSLSDLKKMAESYRTNLVPDLQRRTDPVYTVADVSKEEFDNISTFLYNAVVKDSRMVDQNESSVSSEFSSYLKKYFDEGLSISDILALRNFVTGYNKTAFTYLKNNIYRYAYGVKTLSEEADPGSFLEKVKTAVNSRIKYLVDNYNDRTTKRTLEFWLTGSAGSATATYNISDFYNNYFSKSNIVEMVTVLAIISYLNHDESEESPKGLFEVSSGSLVRTPSKVFEQEAFYDAAMLNIDLKDFYFTGETAHIVTETQIAPTATSNGTVIKYIELRSDSGSVVSKIPYALFTKTIGGTETLSEKYIFLTDANISNNEISYTDLMSDLRDNIISFVDNIDISSQISGISGIDQDEYAFNISYFLVGGTGNMLNNIGTSIRELSRTFYDKDQILQNHYITTTEAEKNEPTIFEIKRAQAGDQLVLIDVKGIDVSANIALSELRTAFGESTLGDITTNENGDSVVNKLTYTVLYKELNPVLRSLCLVDVQEFKFARLFSDFNHDPKSVLELNTQDGVSYLTNLEAFYRSYTESNEIFRIDDNLSRYKFLYSNMYMARIADESDIIGHYVGDSSSEASFTNNYGSKDYHKAEIQKFLEIYKETRDYYYRVLLNKSFIQEEMYFLYEKMVIGFLAIERFLTSKMESMREPEFFNDTDIFNFLESYGLGVLNQYDFFLGSRNYKINMIKNFAALNKSKGSKDVIDLLARIFDVGDTLVDINKFILAEQVNWTEENSDEVAVSTTESSGVYTIDGTSIKVYDEGRIYYIGGVFKNAAGTTVSTPTTDYIFDEENYRLYNTSMVSQQFVLRSTVPLATEEGYSASTIYFNELNETFYLGATAKTKTNISVVNELPISVQDGEIYYRNTDESFWIVESGKFVPYKVYDYYPSVIKDNINKTLVSTSAIYQTLQRYDGFTFFTKDANTDTLNGLFQYQFTSNRVASRVYTDVNELPKQPYVIDVPIWRLLISEGYITRQQYESKSPMVYYLEEGTTTGNRVFVDLNDTIVDRFGYDIADVNLLVIPQVSVESGSLRFVEVPYSSDNGTREINNNLLSGTNYTNFLEVSPTEKIDPYWTKENVPEQTLLDIGIDSVETKYLSLIVSENIYRRYAISRYALSAIEFLDEFVIRSSANNPTNDSVVDRIVVDSGQNLFGEASIHEYYMIAKILYKAVLKLYSAKIGDLFNKEDSASAPKFYGINKDYDWSHLESFLSKYIVDFDSIKDEFLSESVREGSTVETFDKFNLYKKSSDWQEYDLGLEYKKDLGYDSDTKELNDVASLLKDSLFASIKTNPLASQDNSGDYVLELFENLNTLRISGSDGGGDKPVSSRWDNLWNYFLSKYFDNKYDLVDETNYLVQKNQSLPNKEELYAKVINSMMKMPIDYLDGILNGSYPSSENINRNREFVEMMETIFENAYMVDAAREWKELEVINSDDQPSDSSTENGDYWYDTDAVSNKLKIRTAASIWTPVVAFETTSNTIGVDFGDLYYDEANEKLYFLKASDPALTTRQNDWVEMDVIFAASEPSSAENGDYWYNTGTTDLKLKSGGSFGSALSYETTDEPESALNTILYDGSKFYMMEEIYNFNDSITNYLSESTGIVDGTVDISILTSDELDEKITLYSEKLITVLGSLESVFPSEAFLQIVFSLKENEQKTLGFVETAIKIFLSYTTQLYSSRFVREYRTPSESPNLYEDINHTLKQNKADYVFSDEKLEIKEV